MELLRDKAGETDGKFVCEEEKEKEEEETGLPKMWMWTVGYSVGDMVYIAQTTADQKQATRFSKVPPSIYFSFIFVFQNHYL